MKRYYLNKAKTGLKALLAAFLLLGSLPAVSQCTANFNYSVGANGVVTVTSVYTATNSTTYWLWNFNGSVIFGGSSMTHTFATNGAKSVCLSLGDTLNNCWDTQCDSINITTATNTVNPCDHTVSYSLSKDSTASLTWNAYPNYPANVTNATWYWGDNSSTTGLYPSHTYSAAGVYSTCVTVSVSCDSLTGTYCYVASIFRSSENNSMITVNVKNAGATGIGKHTKQDNALSIYPNPNNGVFTLDLKEQGQKGNTVFVYNMMGQKVAEKYVPAGDKQALNLSELESGTYLVKINTGSGYLHKKVTIQK